MRQDIFAVAFVGASAMASTAGGEVLVTFAQSRGGNSSVSGSPYYATLRSDIASQLPSYSIASTTALSAASLAGADVVWIGSVAANGLAVTLSAAEQAALMGFVMGGGTAVLFCDNSTFAGAAPAANASFCSQFGLTIGGTFPASSPHTVVNSSNFIMNGVFGAVGSTLVTDFPGSFSAVPSNAQVLARLNANSQASVVWIPAGALGPTSGDVILFSDSGYRNVGGALSANFDRMYLNILAHVPSPSAASVMAMGLVGLSRRRR